jgi:tellurite resistance protein
MFDSNAFPLMAGFVILVLILVPNVLLWLMYRKYKRVAKALPDPKALEQADSRQLDQRRAALSARLLEDWSRVPDDEIERARHALWTAMLLESAADGSIDHREMEFVADLFGRMGGKKMDFRPVVHAAELAHSDRKTALSEIARARGVSQEAKQQILAGAFLVSVSDHALAAQETECLVQIADALGLSARDRKAMLEEITGRFEA